MALSFLTPLWGLVGFLAAFVLWAMLANATRARRFRRLCGTKSPPRRRRASHPFLTVMFCATLVVAAAQPVLRTDVPQSVRTDAEVYVVLDISRSMLAASAPDAPSRFTRAVNAAADFRDALSDVPVGIASLTDRTLVHLFPTDERSDFSAALRELDIERPPPRTKNPILQKTTLTMLPRMLVTGYFSGGKAKRAIVVFTDGESRPIDREAFRKAFASSGVQLLFVRFWDAKERVFDNLGVPEAAYIPDEMSAAMLEGVAEAADGRIFSERDTDGAVNAVREFLGDGPRVITGDGERSLPLAPYAVGIAAVLASALFVSRQMMFFRRNR